MPKSNAAVVLLHAFPLDSRMWMPQAGALSDHYCVIVPDLRGFGAAYDQLGARDEIPIDLLADDVARLLDERGFEKAVIGGISRGGMAALAFARKYPQRLRGVMLFATRPGPSDEKERRNWKEMAERLRTGGTGFLPDVMRDRLLGPSAREQKPELVDQVNRIILSQKADAVAAAAKGMIARPDARPGLSHIRAPSLAMAGSDDAAFEATQSIARAIPNARFIEVKQAGHLINIEQPDFVTGAIRQFLSAI